MKRADNKKAAELTVVVSGGVVFLRRVKTVGK